jgi:hypothetical protein
VGLVLPQLLQQVVVVRLRILQVRLLPLRLAVLVAVVHWTAAALAFNYLQQGMPVVTHLLKVMPEERDTMVDRGVRVVVAELLRLVIPGNLR